MKTTTHSTSNRTRIAPSPTGMPHIATLFQAVIDYIIAKQTGGQFIIRIEDTDQSRFVPGAEEAIYDMLSWAGINPDESPVVGGPHAPYKQSERLPLYQRFAKQLVDAGHAYYCFCSPKRLEQVRQQKQQAGLPPMYDQHCRSLDIETARQKAQTEPYVIRLKVPANETLTLHDEVRGDIRFESNIVDDQVLLKSDGFPTYHLGVVVDDHDMQITHVIRGEEWISSAPKHLLLYKYFNWPLPKFIHTPLLRNPDKSKLSKRHGHASVSWYQQEGYLPEAVINFLLTRVWNHPKGKEVFSLQEAVATFDVKAMHIQGPIVDLDKLNWLNGQWIRRFSDQELLASLKPFQPSGLSDQLLQSVLPLIKDRLERLAQLEELTNFFYQSPNIDSSQVLKQSKMSFEETRNYLTKVISAIESIENWSVESIETALRRLQESEQIKPKPAFMTIRVVITGKIATPPLFDVIHVLGQKEVVNRLKVLTIYL